MYSIHEISSMFGFNRKRKQKSQKIKKKDNSSSDKKVQNNDDLRWSLYTKKAPTLWQSLFGYYVCFKASLPTRFIYCSKWWKLTPKPHDAMVPRRGVIVKNHGTPLIILLACPSTRWPSCSLLQEPKIPRFLWCLRHQPSGKLLKRIVILFNINVVTWLGLTDLHKFAIHESYWSWDMCCFFLPDNLWRCHLGALSAWKEAVMWCIL